MATTGSYHAERLRHMKCEEEVWAPPMLFNEIEKKKSSSKKDDDDEPEDKSKHTLFKVPFDKTNTKRDRETFERKVQIFDDGTPEEHIEFRKSVEVPTKQLGCTKCCSVRD